MHFEIKESEGNFLLIEYYPDPYYPQDGEILADRMAIEANDVDDLIAALDEYIEGRNRIGGKEK